jgi:hypothetical protein
MELSREQIDRVREFVRKKGIEFFDLQEELVDHLASSIEDRMSEETGLTFEEALRASYKDFGLFGFDDVLVERQKSLGKYYYRRLWIHFLHFWKPPQIFMTLVSGIVSWYAIFRYDALWIVTGSFGVLFMYWLVMAIKDHRDRKGKPKLLFDGVARSVSFTLLFIPINLLNVFNVFDDVPSVFAQWYVTLALPITLVLVLASRRVVRESFREIEEQYPELAS